MKSIISLSSNNWQYLLTLFLGCLLACTMGAFGPIYMNALNRLGFESELTRILGETIDITIFGARLPASSSRLNNTSDLVDKTLYSYFDESITYQHRTYKSGVYQISRIYQGISDIRGYLGYIRGISGVCQRSGVYQGSIIW